MIRKTALLLLFLIMVTGLFGQLSKKHKNLFLEAEYNFLIEYYQKALHQFENLLLVDPENSNLNYLCGLSASKLPGSNELTIQYLENAVNGVADSYRQGSYKESNAPYDAYLLLARSYHIANRFNEAIHYYTFYRDSTELDDFSEIEFVNQQIKSVELAMSMLDQPRKIRFERLLESEKHDRSYSNPVVSGNDSTLIYLEDKYGNFIIMMASLMNGTWSKPRMINGELGVSGNYEPTCLSYDGNALYLVNRDYYNTELYVAEKSGKRWKNAELLNKNINSRYSENHAAVSKDGNQLFFTSDRKGSIGGMDIYRSVKGPEGEWMEAENLGPGINTIYNEATPFMTDHDSKLYFSSEGHHTMGGYDIFYSTTDDKDAWSEPVNIGYPVNTADDNLFYNPGWSDQKGYYAWRVENQTRSTLNALSFPVTSVPGKNQLADAVTPETSQTKEFTGDTPAGIANNQRNADSTNGEQLASNRSKTSHDSDNSEYPTLNSILFEYNNYRLSHMARKEVRRIYSVMHDLPESSIVLTGHTDSKGSEDYNLILSYKRAESVANYLETLGLSKDRISIAARGESDPVAINRYEDGSDAPNGRLLNRHTSFKFRNLPDDRVRVAEIMVPEKLRPVQDLTYNVILTENEQKISKMPTSFFGSNIEIVESGGRYIYLSERFERKNQAVELLNKAIDYGFPEARIMESRRLATFIDGGSVTNNGDREKYTIQIMALKRNRDASYFKDLGPVMKYSGTDGFNRYTYGLYSNEAEATSELKIIKQKGYRQAFVISMHKFDETREKMEAPAIFTENLTD